MEHILLSYHAIGTFCGTLLSVVMTLFLFTKPGKTAPTWMLAFAYLGFTMMFLGYFVSYTVFHEIGAFHRWLTVMVLFAQAPYLMFAYYFPENDRPREARIAIPIAVLLAVIGWGRFAYITYTGESFYSFEAHTFQFAAGRIVAINILFFFLWMIVVFLRKALRYTEYTGALGRWLQKPEKFFSLETIRFNLARLISIPIVLLFPRGKKAQAASGFAIGILLLMATGYLNLLNKGGSLDYETYGFLFSIFSLVAFFVIFMSYLNNSPEPTTFMVKLIGISLVTLLLMFTFVGNITLANNEANYDAKHLAEVTGSRQEILAGDFQNIDPEIMYVMRRPAGPGLFADNYEILFNREGALAEEGLKAGREVQKRVWMEQEIPRIRSAGADLSPDELEQAALARMSEIDPPLESRLYRDAGDYFIHFDFEHENFRYEVGFSYLAYRHDIHAVALQLVGAIVLGTLIILLVFPLFFRSSLVKPLNNLLDGVKEVNAGDLDVVVPIKSQDEIGYLAGSFNGMVASIKDARDKLQDYADNLEDKVETRTKEVREKMEEIHKLKVQQDGDYFLTSLLAQPLFYNANKSQRVQTDFIINQKKSFEFRNRVGQLGGDICVTGNLRLGNDDSFRRYTMCMNGDAMGKSMQGAGGSLVMGVVMNSIMARSAANNRILDVTPEQWLTDIYNEIHNVFKSFDGTMVISASVFLVDDLSGLVHYFNAEHPASVLYRNGKAGFIEEDLQLRKLGLDSELEFKVYSFQMEPGDVIIIGSDGRDDINLTPGEETRLINEDEFLFLKFVEQGDGDIGRVEKLIRLKGEVTDDLSLLRIGFCEPDRESVIEIDQLEDSEHVEAMVEQGRKLYREGKMDQALSVLQEAYAIDSAHVKLNKLLGLLSFKGRDYGTAVEVINKYLAQDPNTPQFWMYLAIAAKKEGRLEEALEASERLLRMDPDNINNLINLGDLQRLMGYPEKAREYLDRARRLDPDNREFKRLESLLG